MKAQTIAVLDLETIKDASLLEGSFAEQKWPPPIGWKIVAIGLVIIDISHGKEGPSYKVRALRCGTGDERECLKKFWSFFDQRVPCVVTWNGRKFDIPVLIQRSFYHGVQVPKWFQSGDRFSNYRYRYCSDWHCDLMDLMSDYGACTPAGMDDVAASVGLPGKIGGHGSEVQGMFDRGEVDKIAAYCECDVLNLYGLYLRWAFITGSINELTYNAALDDLFAFLTGQVIQKPHCGDFLLGWKRSPPLELIDAVPSSAALKELVPTV